MWIANGATVAWAVNPETRMVAVFRADGTSDVVHDTGVASAAPALSDFALRLEDLFVGLE